jgi:hypothetical protein
MPTGRARDEQKGSQWRRWIALWQRSGLSVRDFCARRGLASASFYYWRQALARRAAEVPAFLPVQVVAEATPPHARASGYDGLYLPDPRTATARIIEVACNAHARRKFYEARGSDALRSHRALAYYRQLYELERAAKDFSDAQRLLLRRNLAMPVLEQFHAWLEEQRP